MMVVTNPLVTALVFLLNVFFGTYIFLVMLRFLLQLIRLGIRHDPLLRLVWKATDLPLLFLYNFIPGWRNIDFSAIILMFCLEMVVIWTTFRTVGPLHCGPCQPVIVIAKCLFLHHPH
jgi:uncharacterized protein YggT (Ycf19 family)